MEYERHVMQTAGLCTTVCSEAASAPKQQVRMTGLTEYDVWLEEAAARGARRHPEVPHAMRQLHVAVRAARQPVWQLHVTIRSLTWRPLEAIS